MQLSAAPSRIQYLILKLINAFLLREETSDQISAAQGTLPEQIERVQLLDHRLKLNLVLLTLLSFESILQFASDGNIGNDQIRRNLIQKGTTDDRNSENDISKYDLSSSIDGSLKDHNISLNQNGDAKSFEKDTEERSYYSNSRKYQVLDEDSELQKNDGRRNLKQSKQDDNIQFLRIQIPESVKSFSPLLKNSRSLATSTQVPSSSQSSSKEGDTGAKKATDYERTNFNIFLRAKSIEMAISVTDIINIIQLVLLVAILFAFWRFEMLIYKIKSQEKYFMSWISFGILITGRFLTYYFAGFLIVTIRCYISSEICGQETDIVRVILSVLSLIASIFFNNLFQFYQHITFPLEKAPWAKSESVYKIMHTVRMVLNALCLSLMDLLQGKASALTYYIILLPFFFIQSALLYLHYTQEIAFDKFISRTLLIIDCIQWGFVTTAILVEIIGDYSDISILGVAFVLSVAVQTFVGISKRRRNDSFLRNPLIKDLSNKDQITLFSILYTLNLNSMDSMDYNKLKDFYFRHQHTCFEAKCPSHRLNLYKSTDHMGDCLLFTDEDLERGVAKDLVWKQVFDTFFFHVNHDSSNNYLYFLEIFVKINKYNHILSSYYKLIEAKDRATSRLDRSKYDFLQNMICEAYSTVRKKHEDYDAERVMNVESEFLQYKMSILRATMHAHQFWASLSSKQIKLEELMDLGDKLVESYMLQKRNYEDLMIKQPDFAEAVLYNYQFCQNVMNFEVEALNASMLYEKIQEKIRITKQNLYNLAKKDFVVIMVTNKNGKKNQVIMVNKLFEIAVGVQAHLVIDKNINNFMPPMISVHHDQFIDNYLKSYNGVPYTRIWNRVWVKKLDETVLPVKAYLISCISQTYGLVLVVFVEIAEPIPIRGILYEATTPFYLIADQFGNVTNITPNFKEKYFNLKDSYLADYKLNINEVFPYIENFTEEELDYGVCTQMNKTFFSEKHNEAKKLVDVILKMNQYQFKLGAKVQELIFVPDMKTLVDMSSFESSETKQDEDQASLSGNEGSIAMRNLQEHELDFSGGSMSSESSNAKSFKLMISLKQQLDLSKLPPSFINLKRGVIIFFLIMIMTLIILLIITLLKQTEFFSLQDEILNCLKFNQKFSNLALSFRMLTYISQRGNRTLGISFIDSVRNTEEYYKDFYYYQTALSRDYSDAKGELRQLLTNPLLQLEEISQQGIVSATNSTFFIGSQQYLSKINFFLSLSEAQLTETFSSFFLSPSMRNLTQQQRDAWFVIQNQNQNLRNYILKVRNLFFDLSGDKQSDFLSILLVINLICISVTVIATLILAPTTSSIDNEQLNVILKWNIVQEDTKLQILEKIDIFNNWMSSTNEDRTKIENLLEKAQLQRAVTYARSKQSRDRDRRVPRAYDLDTPSLAQTKMDSYMQSYEINPSVIIESQRIDSKMIEQPAYAPSGFKRQSFLFQSMKNMRMNEVAVERNIDVILESNLESPSAIDRSQMHQNSTVVDRSFKNLLEARKPIPTRYTSHNAIVSSAMYHETAQDMIIPADKSGDNKEESTLQERDLFSFNKQITRQTKTREIAPESKGKHVSRDKEKQSSNSSSYTYSLNDIMSSKPQRKNQQKSIAFGPSQFREDQYKISEEDRKENPEGKIQKQFKKKDIKALFRQVKIRRYLAFLVFVGIIVGFQFSQYMINYNLVVNQFKSIEYQKIFIGRLTCLTACFRYMLESFSQNQTMTLGFDKMPLDKYILQTCGQVESQISSYQKNRPLALDDLGDELWNANSGQLCSMMFQQNGKIPNSTLLSRCQTDINGVLQNGLGNAISQMYYYMTNSLLQFQGSPGISRSRKYLDELVYSPQTWNYLRMLTDIIKPICDTLSVNAKSAIHSYITTQMTIYYTVFSIFISFLAISLIVVIKFMLIALKKIVLRTKILIKIIPIQELKRILDRDKEKEDIRDQIKENTVKIGLLRAAQGSGIVRHFTQSLD